MSTDMTPPSAGSDTPGGGVTPAVDWTALREAATAAAQLAYCPYSSLQVGAAAIMTLSAETTANTLIPMDPFLCRAKRLILLHLARLVR